MPATGRRIIGRLQCNGGAMIDGERALLSPRLDRAADRGFFS
jgi:hypothetical protein